MTAKHFTDVTPVDIGILEDAENGLLIPEMMSVVVAQRIWWLQIEGWLVGLKLTSDGKKILKSLADFKENLEH